MIDEDFDPLGALEQIARETQINSRAIDYCIRAGDSQTRSLKTISDSVKVQNDTISVLTKRIERLERALEQKEQNEQ